MVVPDAAVNADSKAEVWAKALEHTYHKVLGAAVFSNEFSPNMMSVLNPDQRDVVDFWGQTRFSRADFILAEAVRACPAETPQRALDNLGIVQHNSLFFKLTEASRERLLASRTINGDTFGDKIAAWETELHDHLGERRVAMLIPPSFAIPIVGGVARWWGFPIPAGNAKASMRLRLARDLWEHVALSQLPVGRIDENNSANAPDRWLWIANLLRSGANLFQGDSRVDVRLAVEWLQTSRDSFALASCKKPRGYELHFLIDCVMLAGYLRDATDLRVALERAVAISLPAGDLREACLSRLREHLSVPWMRDPQVNLVSQLETEPQTILWWMGSQTITHLVGPLSLPPYSKILRSRLSGFIYKIMNL